MLLNCGAGEDSWESLGLQGDPTCQSSRKSVLNIHWKDWCWSWNSNTLATSCEELTHWKRPYKDWRQEKGTTEDKMVGYHYQVNGQEFEQVLGFGDGQGSLVCHSPWGCKESTQLATELNWKKRKQILFPNGLAWLFLKCTLLVLSHLVVFISVTPWTVCSPPASSVNGILQARLLV